MAAALANQPVEERTFPMTNHESSLANPPLRILSIDGGGLKGAMPAAFLATIEEQTGQKIVDHFDLIVGTSTGGIIALGLGLGLPAAEILDPSSQLF